MRKRDAMIEALTMVSIEAEAMSRNPIDFRRETVQVALRKLSDELLKRALRMRNTNVRR